MMNNNAEQTPGSTPSLSSILNDDDEISDEEWERRYRENMKIRGVKLPAAGAELDAMLDTIPLFATQKPSDAVEQRQAAGNKSVDDDDDITPLSNELRDHAAIQALVDETPAVERAE